MFCVGCMRYAPCGRCARSHALGFDLVHRAVQKFCHGFARGLDRNCWRSAELTAAPQQLRSDSKHSYQALTGGAALWPPCDAAGGVLRPSVSEQIPTAS